MTNDQKNRLGGLFLIFFGAVLGWMSIWRPYQAALAGTPSLSLNRTGIAVSILFPILGLLLAIGGESVNNHIKAHTATGKRTRLGWLYIICIGAVALTVFWIVERKFEAMGYSGG